MSPTPIGLSLVNRVVWTFVSALMSWLWRATVPNALWLKALRSMPISRKLVLCNGVVSLGSCNLPAATSILMLRPVTLDMTLIMLGCSNGLLLASCMSEILYDIVIWTTCSSLGADSTDVLGNYGSFLVGT